MGTGNVQNLIGQPNTFAQGINLSYLYQQGPDNYVDELGEQGGRLYFLDQNGIGRGIYYRGGNYRTILSSVIFGALQGTERTRLLRSYLQYLLSGTGMEEEKEKPILTITPNPVSLSQRMKIKIPEGIERVAVFNSSGRLIREWKIQKGKTLFWDLLAEEKIGVSPGTYFLLASGSGKRISQSFILLP
uniref:T9SS type A sorting domain-containing protein n=1 Tax=candidate division WOR-3 bacterium TaxID=2052148 RepID=A0A7C3UQ64_UNCW3